MGERKEYEYYYEEGEAEAVLAADKFGSGLGGRKGETTITHFKSLVDGEETVVELRDPETEAFTEVKGILHQDAENYPDCPLIWLMATRAGEGRRREPKPWAIEILEEKVDDEQISYEVKPKVRIAYGGRKGRMLADMLRERDEKLEKK